MLTFTKLGYGLAFHLIEVQQAISYPVKFARGVIYIDYTDDIQCNFICSCPGEIRVTNRSM